jgi:hypothetical protein
MVKMARLETPDEHLFLNEEQIKYLKKKNEGGRGNRNGYDFELLVATRCAISEVMAVRRGEANPSEIFIAVQVDGFIDDFAIVRGSSYEWFEMKSGDDLSWAGGDRPLKDNFRLQQHCDYRLKRKASYNLVVSSRAAAHSILRAKSLSARGVTVSLFPNLTVKSELLAQSEQFAILLEDLVRSDEQYEFGPTITDEDRIQALLAIRMAVYETTPSKLRSIEEILRWCDLHNGSFAWRSAAVKKDVMSLLRSIPNAHFVVSRQRIHYNLGSFEGRVPFVVGTQRFQDFEDVVLQTQPSTCQEFNEMLRAMERNDG